MKKSLVCALIASFLPFAPAANAYEIGLFGPQGKTVRLSTDARQSKVYIETCRLYSDLRAGDSCQASETWTIQPSLFLELAAQQGLELRALPGVSRKEYALARAHGGKGDRSTSTVTYHLKAAQKKLAYLKAYESESKSEISETTENLENLQKELALHQEKWAAAEKIMNEQTRFAEELLKLIKSGTIFARSMQASADFNVGHEKEYAVLNAIMDVVEPISTAKFNSVEKLVYQVSSYTLFPDQAKVGDCTVYRDIKYSETPDFRLENRLGKFLYVKDMGEGRYDFADRSIFEHSSSLKPNAINAVIRSAIAQGLCK